MRSKVVGKVFVAKKMKIREEELIEGGVTRGWPFLFSDVKSKVNSGMEQYKGYMLYLHKHLKLFGNLGGSY